MKSKKFYFSLAVVLAFAFSAFAQTKTFSNENVEYTFDLPNENWIMVVKPSKLSPNVEYVYNDRSDGHFEIRKLTANSGETMTDVIRSEETKLQFLPGFVVGKEEVFRGNFDGKVLNYEYVRSGRNWSGRMIFLKIDDKTYYALRFTGMKDKLLSIRNNTNSIGRSFDLVKK